jgi:hypothetical protein
MMRFRDLSRWIQASLALLGGVLVLASPARAQLQVGNNLNMNLSGSISAGYNADYGNLTSSDHSLGLGGSGALSGYYFNPNFISFNATPYYSQSRDNSTTFSTANASGIDSSVSFFQGSNFPGNFSYSKALNSSGSFDVPGSANFTTHGSSQSFGINWMERMPNWPVISAAFQNTGSDNTVYGVSRNSTSSSHMFNLNGSDRLLGFGLNASYFMGGSSSAFPEIFAGTTNVTSSDSTDHGFALNASRSLPLDGNMYASYTDTTAVANNPGSNVSYTLHNFITGSTFQPAPKFSLSGAFSYSSSLSGSVEQQVLAAGGVVPVSTTAPGGSAISMTGAGGYAPMKNMEMQAEFDRRIQQFNGVTYGQNTYTFSTDYFHNLFGGIANAGMSVIDSTTSNSPGSSLGFAATSTYNRKIGKWNMNGSFSYSQNVQTLLVTYMNSSYGYSATVSRRGRLASFSFGGGSSRSGLVQVGGTTYSNDNVNATLSFRKWADMGVNYSKSNGNGILTSGGVTISPVPAPILPATGVILFGGRSYSFSIASSPISRLTLSASYSKANSSSSELGLLIAPGLIGSMNATQVENAMFQYQFRKMYVNGGYSKLVQGFSASGPVPQQISSYYFSISRWFNFF